MRFSAATARRGRSARPTALLQETQKGQLSQVSWETGKTVGAGAYG